MHTVSKAETILHQPAMVVLSADHHPVFALLCNLHATLALASLPFAPPLPSPLLPGPSSRFLSLSFNIGFAAPLIAGSPADTSETRQ